MSATYAIPGVYSRQRPRAEGFLRVRTDICGFVGVAGPNHVGEAIAVDDWKSYVAAFRTDAAGAQIPPPGGSVLDSTLRDFFANGGRRAWIVNVAAEISLETDRNILLNNMMGLGDDLEPHGLELLLIQHEVSIVAIPDLHATVVTYEDVFEDIPLPGNPCFTACTRLGRPGKASDRKITAFSSEQLVSNDDLMWAQQYLIARLQREPWRWFGLLSTPRGLNAAEAVEWRQRLTATTGADSVAGLYWPWLRMQDSPGAPSEIRTPLGAVAGVFADTDIALGPHVAPANRNISGGIATEIPISDAENALAYDAGVNVLRDFAGHGLQLWGARTLLWLSDQSRSDALAFVNARRCLNAIARTCEVIGQPIVFEPNDVILRIRLHQLVTDYLLGVFASGALMGDRPDQGFFVAVEPVEESPEGHLICRIGVALAAPAEFIEFRIGRENGTIEKVEAA